MTEAEIVVRNCTVDVLRRGGWSWGPAPDELTRRVLAVLPDLLAERFAAELDGDEDVEITEPVRLDIRMPLTAPAMAGRTPSGGVERALVPPPDPSPVVRSPLTTATPDAPGSPPVDLPIGSAHHPPDLVALLAALADPEQFLRLLPPSAARHYRAEIARITRPPQSASPNEHTPAPSPESPDRFTPEALPRDQDPAVRPQPAGHGRARATGDVEVTSVLPFLLLAALHRIGMIDGLGAVLADAGLSEDAPLFAAALAHQVLDPKITATAMATAMATATAMGTAAADAAAAAGLAEPVDGRDLADLIRRAAPAAPLLDALTGHTLCRGHQPDRPLLLAAGHARHGGGLLLVEPDGLFPIAWTDEAARLTAYRDACGGPVLLVGGATVGPGSALAPVPLRDLRTLVAAGVPLICDAPPTRGEDRWRRLPGPRRLWAAGDVPAAPPGPDLATLTGQLDELMAVLAARRPARSANLTAANVTAADQAATDQAATDLTATDRSIALLAALGLGTLAWLLWRHREPPDPQLALRRLGDLSAVVHFAPNEVAVRLPLGRRHRDLRDRGLLADVPGVPWFNGRPLTFIGG